MQTQEFKTLVKSLTTLVQIITLYLLITWTYGGLKFLVETIFL